METLKQIWRQQGVVLAIGLLLVVEILSLFSNAGVPALPVGDDLFEARPISEPLLRLSEIDGPRIDSSAAVVVVDEAWQNEPVAPKFPGELWVFLLFVYVALLIFNFSSTFEKAVTPQWFWELLYTILALLSWLALDPLGLYPWFPLMVIKSGLIIYITYLYLLEKKRLAEECMAPTITLLPGDSGESLDR